jgi:glucose-6-phosphate isomerase
MEDRPFSLKVDMAEGILSHRSHHIVRRLSALAGQFCDSEAYETLLAQEDLIIYEVYEFRRPEAEGELFFGISIIHPGKVGEEYFMTKGHFHAELETAEVYYCLEGEGRMVMETPEGESAIEEFHPNKVLYVPPRWAHRSVNTNPMDDLVLFFVYPAYAGHDYRTIEQSGFKKLVIERQGIPHIVDNPR